MPLKKLPTKSRGRGSIGGKQGFRSQAQWRFAFSTKARQRTMHARKNARESRPFKTLPKRTGRVTGRSAR